MDGTVEAANRVTLESRKSCRLGATAHILPYLVLYFFFRIKITHCVVTYVSATTEIGIIRAL